FIGRTSAAPSCWVWSFSLPATLFAPSWWRPLCKTSLSWESLSSSARFSVYPSSWKLRENCRGDGTCPTSIRIDSTDPLEALICKPQLSWEPTLGGDNIRTPAHNGSPKQQTQPQ